MPSANAARNAPARRGVSSLSPSDARSRSACEARAAARPGMSVMGRTPHIQKSPFAIRSAVAHAAVDGARRTKIFDAQNKANAPATADQNDNASADAAGDDMVGHTRSIAASEIRP